MSEKTIPLEVLRKCPKADLHRHLDGSVRVSTVMELAAEQGVLLPTDDAEELEKMVRVGAECKSLVEYLRSFSITLLVMQRPDAITRCMYEVCEDAVLDGVRYLEVRFSPILHINNGMSLSAVMRAVCDGLILAEYRLPITVRIIVCGMRQLDAKVTESLAEVAWRYRDRGVVGFDLAGPEDGFPAKIHKSAFDIIRSSALNCTLHSGEASGWKSIQHAIRYCGAHRIGHGTRLRESEELLQFVVDRRIPLEVCLTSNLQTKAVESLEEHPIREYYEKGVVVVPCVDNSVVSNVTLSGEYELLQRTYGFSAADVLHMIDEGFKNAFVDIALKTRLRFEAVREVLRLMNENNIDLTGIDYDHFSSMGCFFVDHPTIPTTPGRVGARQEPPITAQVVKALPKADLHCRLDGSVSLPGIWKEVEMLDGGPSALRKALSSEIGTTSFDSFEDLVKLLQPPNHTSESTRRASALMNYLLQTRGQLERGLEDVLRNAEREGVSYMELVFFPSAHTRGGLTMEGAADVVLNHLNSSDRVDSTKVQCRVVLAVAADRDPPLVFHDVAKLVVANRHSGVAAFGVFGEDLKTEEYKYFTPTFDFLKLHNANVVMAAGKQHKSSVTSALAEGGAARISGAYQVHKVPRVLCFMADHGIPIELNMTDSLLRSTDEMRLFARNPIRLFLDQDSVVCICSFAKTLYPTSRTDMLLNIVRDCCLSPSDTVKLLSHGFNSAFVHYDQRQSMLKAFWNTTVEKMEQFGFSSIRKSMFYAFAGDRSSSRHS